jgi:dihydrofolate reductase
MRKLKLQVNMSLDGFVDGINNHVSLWAKWNEEARNYSIANLECVDYFLVGRKEASGMVSHWAAAAENPDDPNFAFGKKFTDIPKMMFSKTRMDSDLVNTTVSNGDLVEEITRLKAQKGGDILAYGGAGFVSSLVRYRLVDDYHLLVNPVALGEGVPIFGGLEESYTVGGRGRRA